MERATDGNGSLNDLPWASVFDPAANARALSAIQAEGFRAASEILDRFVGMVGQGGNGAQPAPTGDVGIGRNSDARRSAVSAVSAVSAAEQWTRTWWATVGQLLLRAAPGGARAPGSAAALDLTNADADGQLCFEVSGTGRAAAEVWLHNRGPTDLGPVRLRCSDLLSHEGHRIDSAAVQFDPDTVPMPARSSRGVQAQIAVAQGLRPGPYRGMVLVTGHPDLWLPVVLRSPPAG